MNTIGPMFEQPNENDNRNNDYVLYNLENPKWGTIDYVRKNYVDLSRRFESYGSNLSYGQILDLLIQTTEG